jgi:AcrR family transcriptional regulator
MTSMPEAARGPGRPRSSRASRAILHAALELLAERGLDGLTMEGIAEYAGVAKTTVYRRWKSPEEVLEAASSKFVTEIGVPDTGTIRGDLLTLLTNAAAVYSGLPGRAMPGLVAAMARSPSLAHAVREGFLAGRRAALEVVLERGILRGELRREIDVPVTLDMLGGPLMYRLLITGEAVNESTVTEVVDTLLVGIAATASSRAGGGRAQDSGEEEHVES